MGNFDRYIEYFDAVDPLLIINARSGDNNARNRLVHDLSVMHAETRRRMYQLFGDKVDSSAPEFIWDETNSQSIMVPTGEQAEFELVLIREGIKLDIDDRQPTIEQLAAQMAIDRYLTGDYGPAQ